MLTVYPFRNKIPKEKTTVMVVVNLKSTSREPLIITANMVLHITGPV